MSILIFKIVREVVGACFVFGVIRRAVPAENWSH